MKSPLVCTTFCLLLLTSCIDGVRPNLETIVHGKVYDPVKDKYLSGVTVELSSCKRFLLYGTLCGNLMESTETDADGNFSFNFRSREGDYGYDVRVVTNESFALDSTTVQNYVEDGNVTTGNVNEMVLYARELNYLVAHLEIRENTSPPLSVQTLYSIERIWSENVDTTVVLKVLPQAENFLRFSFRDEELGRKSTSTELLRIGMEDTIRFSTVVNVPELGN